MAQALAKELSLRVGHVDQLLVSPASRAQQTATPLISRLEPDKVRVEPVIYDSGPAGLLELLNTLPEQTASAVVVGHEPTISSLARALHDADDALAAQISFGVPTATAVVVSVSQPWDTLTMGSAHIREVLSTRR